MDQTGIYTSINANISNPKTSGETKGMGRIGNKQIRRELHELYDSRTKREWMTCHDVTALMEKTFTKYPLTFRSIAIFLREMDIERKGTSHNHKKWKF